MNRTILHVIATGAALAVALLSGSASAQAPVPPPPQPQMPPFLVPSLSVNLMTAEGAAAFGAQWKTMEAKIVERAPMPGHSPGYDKAYDISPHAGEAGFDDS